jgi:hypothetical protein
VGELLANHGGIIVRADRLAADDARQGWWTEQVGLHRLGESLALRDPQESAIRGWVAWVACVFRHANLRPRGDPQLHGHAKPATW